MSRDLIVFGEDWGGLPSSTQHLIGHVASSRKVVWINSIGLRRPRFRFADMARAWRKITASRGDTTRSATTVHAPFPVINPITLPVPRSSLERRFAAGLLTRQIKPVLRRERIESPILWTSLPTAVDVAGQLGDTKLVYYCGDDFSALAGVDHQTVRKRELELVDRADLVLVASEPLALRHRSPKTRLLPHGVSFDLFSTPAPRAKDLPNDGRPIAGFYGSLSEWLDIELLTEAIRRCPHWHFVFVGKSVIDTSALRAYDNVHLLGDRPHHALPGYSQHWTASLLPFRDTPQIRACNPLKLREYLATGRPVISTDFTALNGYREFVCCVHDADTLAKALHLSQNRGRCQKQINAVAGTDWRTQARQVSDWLEQL